MRTSLSLTVYAVLSVVLLCAIVNISEAQTDYCRPSLCIRKPHVACNNDDAFGPKCEKNAKAVPMKKGLKNLILDKHNLLRNTIAEGKVGSFKPAARMATVQWDIELEYLALLNVKRCEMSHDACRSTAQFPYAGQMLAYSGWSTATPKSVASIVDQHIMMWYNEKTNATMSRIDRYTSNGKRMGNFAQLMIDKATHVGCSIVRQTKNYKIFQYMACNYAYEAFLKLPVYESASVAGSNCTTGPNPFYTSLCSVDEVYDLKTVNKINRE